MKKYFSLLSLAWVLFAPGARGQWSNDTAIVNAGSLATDLNGQWHNRTGATYSTAGSAGAPADYAVFYHQGLSGTGVNAVFINDGSYDASVNGRDYFSGPGGLAGQQEIAGTAMPVFGELFLQNGAGVELNITNSNGIRVAGSVRFENGITTTLRSNTNTGAVKLDDNATYTHSALGNTQHVNGYVSKTGDDAFIFPVGSGSRLRTLAMSAPATITDAYCVAWIAGSPSVTGDPSDGGAFHPVNVVMAPITSVSASGQWDWIPLNGTGSGMTITVSIPDLSSSGIPASDLRLVGWNGSSWTDLSGGSTASGNTEGSTLSGTMQAGISAVGIGSVNLLIPLPVNLLYFRAAAQNGHISLTWETTGENDMVSYGIERSADGITWEIIGNRPATGGNGPSYYKFIDVTAPAGKWLYRLRETDINGRQQLSSIVHAEILVNDLITVYPNPARQYITINGAPENSRVQLINSLGQVIREQIAGTHIVLFNLEGTDKGIYWVRVIANNLLVSQTKIARISD